MKRVLLINTNLERLPYPVPPLGICLLATALQENYHVSIYDGVFDEGKNLLQHVASFEPDYIGFSIRNIDDLSVDQPKQYLGEIIHKFIAPVRSVTRVPTMIGGSGYSIYPMELLRLTGVDYGIVGEAEVTLPILLGLLEKGEDTTVLKNVIRRRDLLSGHSPESSAKSSLQPKPFRNSHFLFSNLDRFIDFTPYQTAGVYSIQSKRGCSHRCIYCTYPWIEGSRYRLREPSDIVTEIEEALSRLGHVTFEFVDSTFNDPAGHAEAICREIIRRKVKTRFRTMGINPRHVTFELIDLMKEAGFVQIDVTPDSASARVLRNLKKGFGLKEIRQAAEIIRETDFPTMWFFVFGGPGENSETVEETFRFIDNHVNPNDMVRISYGLRIYPFTPLYKLAIRQGYITDETDLLKGPVFYISKEIGKEPLRELLRLHSLQRHHCVPGDESIPQPELLREAIAIRSRQDLQEPMFRTLIRIRKEWMKQGRL
ncbi:MAG: radical SAM protein [Bacteroidetes bacterium]|nr:radical SAM protein [Bacteroidota bacterium]